MLINTSEDKSGVRLNPISKSGATVLSSDINLLKFCLITLVIANTKQMTEIQDGNVELLQKSS